MQTRRRFRLLICAGLLTAALSGCGGSSTSESIPSTVSIFYEHSVIFRNHTTFTMGYNGFGQLGDGTLTKREVATAVPGMVNMTKGVAGVAHTMVMDGTSVYAWGYNIYGQLGNTDVSTSYPDAYKSSPVPVMLPDGAVPTDIAAGGYHSLAVADGKLYGWGSNVYRQVGNNSATIEPAPVQLTTGHDEDDLTGLTATRVAAGGRHSLALFDNGAVYAWGNNTYGQVGFSNLSTSSSRPRKVELPVTGKIEQVAALSSASLALDVSRDGVGNVTGQTLWGWGYNDAGELSAGITPQTSSPVPVEVTSVTVIDGTTPVIKSIATGINHILLLMGPRDTLTNDGTWFVKAIGLNGYGQLGNNTTTSSLEFVLTLNSGGSAPLTNVDEIAAFGTSSFARVGGDWYGWGNNGIGQLGNKVTTDSVAFFETPVTVKFP